MATKTPVSAEQLARELAARNDVDETTALQILHGICECMREHLRTGATVDLGGLFTLSFAGGPEIREESDGFAAYAPSRKELEVVPLNTLRDDLKKACNAAIYYISANNNEFVDLLAQHFGKRGWQLIHKRSGEEAQRRLDDQPPAAIIFESLSDGWEDLVRELKCNPATNRVPVLGVFPEGGRKFPILDITVQPDDIIYEPFDFRDFCATAGDELMARVCETSHDVFELDVQLPGSERCRRRLRSLVEEALYRCGLDETFGRAVGAALGEALENAWRHGHQLVDCCTIGMRLLLDGKRLVVSVRDSGEGFDHAAVLTAARGRRSRTNDPLAKAADALKTRRGTMREGGIARILGLVDRVEFNRQGNEMVLTKRRPRDA